MRLRPFEYHEAGSLEAALDLTGRYGDDCRLVAGGTALLLMIRYGIVRPRHVLSLHGVADLAGIGRAGTMLRIGALTPHAEVAASPLVREHCPVLAVAASRVATPAIRNMGTIGGNLCYAESASDVSPALLGLGARAVIAGRGGPRRVDLAGGFFRGFYETALEEGEILVAVEVPPQARPGGAAYVKWSPRSREDKALVGVAAIVDGDGAGGVCRELRLGLGGVNATPVRLPRAEAAARGQRLTDEVIRGVARAAAEEVEPISDVQGSSAYRRQMVEVWVGRTLRTVRGQMEARP